MTPKESILSSLELIKEIKTYSQYKNSTKSKAELESYEDHINNLLKQVKQNIESINDFFVQQEIPRLKETVSIRPKLEEVPKPIKISAKKTKVIKSSGKAKESLLKELSIGEESLKKFLHKTKRIEEFHEEPYILYKSNNYGKLSNYFFEKLSFKLTKRYPSFFKNLYTSLISSNLKVLSKTYTSIILFSSLLSFILFALTFFFILPKNPIGMIKSIFIGLLGFISTFSLIYLYPQFTVKSRRSQIKNDLPFAIIHMSAVASSGAKPISIFNLILKSEEYKGLAPEIRKIVNYINLFGYDLSTSLRLVASTTPSSEFKELLTGMVSTIESGGSLNDYLKGKAEDTLSTYKLERKKYTEVLAAYSDIYTAILIAAPLLFITTLAIINILGGKIGALSVASIATTGTYIIIPFLNIAFIVFLNMIQPE